MREFDAWAMTPAQIYRAIQARDNEYQRNGELLAVMIAPVMNCWTKKKVLPYHLFPTENLKPANEQRTEDERIADFENKVARMGPKAVEVRVL